jgi:hypothetical protein
MGVDVTHYVVVGIKTGFRQLENHLKIDEDRNLEDCFDEITSEYDAHVGDFAYISDGMNGEYAVLGIIVSKGAEEDGEGLDMTDCIEALNKYKMDVSEKLRLLGITIGKISVYAFTHYS